MPTILDLFSGCGGFSLGAHQAGFETALAIDIDPILSSSFAKNFPRARLLRRNIQRVTKDVLAEYLPDSVDGVIGGPPCQAFSEIGRRDADDPRRKLVREFFRIVATVKPKFFVFENVRGLGFSENIGILKANLSRLGPNWDIVGPFILNAADFGAPTRRLRLFVFGFDRDRMSPLSAAELTRPVTQKTTVRDAIADLATARFERVDDRGFDTWKYDLRRAVSPYASSMRNKSGTFTGHKKTVHSDETLARFRILSPGSADPIGKNPRLRWSGLCPTIRAGTGSDKGSHQAVRPIHPELDRVITPREAARLQGFPDSFEFHPTVWHSFRMIGNSVSPVIARVLLSRVALRLDISPVSMAAE